MAQKKMRTPLLVALVALVLAALPLAVLLQWPDVAQRAGLTEKLWYVATVLLGLGAALSLYSLFSGSYAIYSGKVMGGKLELGGPAVLVLVFVVLGFALPPKPAGKFDVAVFFKLPGGANAVVLSGASLVMDLGADRRTETVDAKGVVRFVGIPSEMAGRTVPVTLKASQHELATGATVTLSQEAVYLDLQWKSWRLNGQVLDETGKSVVGASVSLADGRAVTDASGRFTMTLSSEIGEARLVLEVQQRGFAPWRNVIGMGTESVAVQLVRKP